MKPQKLLPFALTALVAVLGAVVVLFLASGFWRTEPGGPQISRVLAENSAPEYMGALDEDVPAPDVEGQTLDGDLFRLSDHEGRVVVLNFWATWCAPCRIEIPDLIEMQEELGADRVRFVGISVDHEEDDVIRAYARDAGINYPVIVDEGEISESFGGVYALPTTFVVDGDGIIRIRKLGLVRKESLMPMLRDLAEG